MQSSIFLILVACVLSGMYSTSVFADRFKVLIMGDSLSAAYNISIEQSWPTLFEQKLQAVNGLHTVINASISGETSAGGIERLPDLLDQHRPTHLILELGGNDGLRGFKFDQTRQNLSGMIEMALKNKLRVLLIGVRLPPNLGPVYNQRFQRIYESISQAYPEVVYLARFLEGVAADKTEYMQPDGIHPTAMAQPLLANRVYQSFSLNFVH